jgi:tight adherence protein C
VSRLAVGSSLVLWVGSTLVLSRMRWFSRRGLADRVGLYLPGRTAVAAPRSPLAFGSFAEALGPLSRSFGERLARLFGVSEPLAIRLHRVHSPLDPTAFRVRQLGWTLAGFGIATVVSIGLQPPPSATLAFLLAGPLLAFLAIEQQVSSASSTWQRRVFLELPVVTEQLAMLLSSGFSLTGALNRIAHRGTGAIASDLRRVCARIRQGLDADTALAEWAELARVPALDRLIPVFGLHREAADLGRLLSDEARAVRRDVHRELIQAVERRGQQVWVPVTVATLVPGAIFLAVPFMEALSTFSN